MTSPGRQSEQLSDQPVGLPRRDKAKVPKLVARALTTRIQVSGWRFLMDRLSHAVMRWDPSMQHEPEKNSAKSKWAGIAVAVVFTMGCVLLSMIMPRGVMRDSDLLVADRDTQALYVRINDKLHPVLNITSANLILGTPKKPVLVKPSELSRLPRGPLVGIFGAPERMPSPDANIADSSWAVCDTASPTGTMKVTVIGAPMFTDDSIGALAEGTAVLARFGDETDLVYNGHRTPIDLNDKAVALAVGLDTSTSPPVPMSRGLHDALNATPQLVVPPIAAAGTPTPPEWALNPSVLIGSIVKVRHVDGPDQLYVVLTDGLQPIGSVTAAIIRNADPRGPPPPIEVPANVLTTIPQSKALDVGFHPDKPLKIVDPVAKPVTCLSWVKGRQDTTARITVLSGRALPLPVSERSRTVEIVTIDPNGTTANNVYVKPGDGWFLHLVGGTPAAPTTPSQWWVNDTGVRFGMVLTATEDAAKSVGLDPASALPAPWEMVRLLPQGPTLSREDALMSHDGGVVDLNGAPVVIKKPAA